MPEMNELSQRLTALEKRVGILEVELNKVRSELNSKIDNNNSVLMDRIIDLEKERVRLATILDGIQARMVVLSEQPTFETGFQAKISQFALFVAAATVGALIVQVVGMITK